MLVGRPAGRQADCVGLTRRKAEDLVASRNAGLEDELALRAPARHPVEGTILYDGPGVAAVHVHGPDLDRRDVTAGSHDLSLPGDASAVRGQHRSPVAGVTARREAPKSPAIGSDPVDLEVVVGPVRREDDHAVFRVGERRRSDVGVPAGAERGERERSGGIPPDIHRTITRSTPADGDAMNAKRPSGRIATWPVPTPGMRSDVCALVASKSVRGSPEAIASVASESLIETPPGELPTSTV